MRSGLLLYSLVKNVAMIQVSYIPGCYGSGRDIKIQHDILSAGSWNKSIGPTYSQEPLRNTNISINLFHMQQVNTPHCFIYYITLASAVGLDKIC